MPIDLQFVVETEIDATWEPLLQQAAEATLATAGVTGPAVVTLLLSDDARLQALNRTFLGYDQPTDVLSFPSGESLTGRVVNLGDIAVSVAQARRQAAVAGHSVAAELQLLLVHGILHLLGHDHAEVEEKAVMWRLQAAVLHGLGVEVQLPA